MMLSRTAAHIYWMSRYLERAENLSRMLDVAFNLALLPQAPGAFNEVSAPLAVTGQLEGYLARHKTISPELVLHYLAFDTSHPQSLASCLRHARENAHAVRGTITNEMWENINATWLETKRIIDSGTPSKSQFFEWVRERSHMFRGMAYSTILRNDAFSFLRLGTYLERADNTARLLDVKSHLIEPRFDDGSADYYLWSALLRSLSAFEAYQGVYRDAIEGRRVAELLILRANVPRSLRACIQEIVGILPQIEGDTGRHVKRLAAQIQTELAYSSIEDILDAGLHEWLSHFLEDTQNLGLAIHDAYLEVV